jgi:hypothetical protein
MSETAAAFSFDAEKHEYRLGSQVVPGCTGVLSSGGLVPYGFVSQDVLERKGELGREVHKACHLHNINKLGQCDPRVQPHLRAWIRFKEQCKSFRLISSEYQTVATVNGMHYGMQLDCNALVDGYDTVIELKIGQIYPHHAIQTAGYAAGLPHPKYTAPMARFMARKRMAVELRANGSSGSPKVYLFEQKSDYDVFLSLLHVTSWKQLHDQTYKEKI